MDCGAGEDQCRGAAFTVGGDDQAKDLYGLSTTRLRGYAGAQ
jgi:hypothetical protein